jgi:hypothetical protein
VGAKALPTNADAINTATGNNTVVFAIVGGGTGVATIDSATGELTLVGPGQITVSLVITTAGGTITHTGTSGSIAVTRLAVLTAGEAVNAAASDTSKDVTFTGASGLSLSAADFAVSSGGTISGVSVNDNTATVSVQFPANTEATAKTYTVSIASTSTKIKGNATVTITQAADRTTLTAGPAVNATASNITTNVTFTGAAGLINLTKADFVVDNGASVDGANLTSDTATVSVIFAANTGVMAKTYTVSIAPGSTVIKGSATVTITQAAATGSASITVGFAYSDITISGNNGTNSISKSGANNTLTLSADGYTGVVWYVDADPQRSISGNRVTLNAADYTTQRHSITFTGQKDGRWYSSRPIPFTVSP